MLNAFRHQRFNTLFSSAIWAWYARAQRLSASEIQHNTTQKTMQGKPTVLNAFRHQRFNTASGEYSKFVCVLCSTPFGIRDSTRLLGVLPYSRKLGAQRLSASEIQHTTLSAITFADGWKCSTPFGIRDSTRNNCLIFLSKSKCAQRLSASEIQH